MGPGDGAAALPTVPASIAVEVVYSPAPEVVDACSLSLPAGSRAADALQASGVLQRHGLDLATLSLGVWGRSCTPDHMLRDRDRVEIYRPLLVDPKEARRLRYKGRARKSAPG